MWEDINVLNQRGILRFFTAESVVGLNIILTFTFAKSTPRVKIKVLHQTLLYSLNKQNGIFSVERMFVVVNFTIQLAQHVLYSISLEMPFLKKLVLCSDYFIRKLLYATREFLNFYLL